MSNQSAILSQIDWEKWFYKPGMPDFQPKINYEWINKAIKLADDYIKLDGKSPA